MNGPPLTITLVSPVYGPWDGEILLMVIDGFYFKKDELIVWSLSGSPYVEEGVSTPFGSYYVVFYAIIKFKIHNIRIIANNFYFLNLRVLYISELSRLMIFRFTI